MKLKNKKTGEIGEIGYIGSSSGKLTVKPINGVACESIASYNSLAELNAEWEDYEEPKKHYEILAMGAVMGREDAEDEIFRNQGQREIGNYFETREEAELAVRKLKAWKRLKDKGFRFSGHDDRDRGQLGDIVIYAEMSTFEYDDDSTRDDLDLLFGGEE